MKIVEYLFYDYSTLFADSANIKYLEKCNSNLKIIYTSNTEKPYFIDNKVDMIYMGSMSEKNQENAITKLKEYKNDLKKYIEDNGIFYASGNSFEIFGKYILDGTRKIECLNIFEYYAVRYMDKRYNEHFIGEYNGYKIVGFRSQFSFCFDNKNKFIETVRGIGLNENDVNEGVHYKNFFGTYLLGPLFILNPLFVKEILRLLDLNDDLIHEIDNMKAYEYRLQQLSSDSIQFRIGEHG